MLAKTGKTASELLAEINERFGPLYSERLDLHTTQETKKIIVATMQKWQPQTLAGIPVVSTNRIDGLKVILENGSWCLVRPSGTEPVFRIYTEAGSVEEKKRIQQEVKKILYAQAKEE